MIFFVVVLVFTAIAKEVEPPVFKISLDNPPEKRWTEVIAAKKPAMQNFIHEARILVGRNVIWGVGSFLKNGYYPLEIQQEIESIADLAEVSFEEALFSNFLYEFYVHCSSIVARDSEGKLIFGRNLDYNFGDLLSKVVVELHVYREQKLLYKYVTFAGYVGVLTGMRENSFAISMDQRNMHDWNLVWEAFYISKGYTGPSLAIRYALENFSDYSEAKEYLATVKLITNAYFIIGGLEGNDGAVITRNRNYAADIWEIKDHTWYVAETNYDHWLPTPGKDDRRDPLLKLLDQVGSKDISEEKMYEILSTPPIYRLDNSTLYTTVMVPKTSYFFARIRH